MQLLLAQLIALLVSVCVAASVAMVSDAFGSVNVFSDVAGPVNCMKALLVPPLAPVKGEVPGVTWANAGPAQISASASTIMLRSFVMKIFPREV